MLCLTVVAAGLLWLSFHIVRLDQLRENDRRETETARQEAELQERISAALYRMDLRLIPLIATETARPVNFYRSNGNGTANQLDSSEFVLLHFEIDHSGQLDSPHSAVFANQQANSNGDPANIDRARKLFRFDTFDRRMSAQSLAINDTSTLDAANEVAMLNNSYAVPAVDRAAAQIKQSRPAANAPAQMEQAKTGKLKAQQARGQVRLNEDFDRRRVATQNFAAQNSLVNQMLQTDRMDFGMQQNASESEAASLGVMQPMWVKDQLLLVRRVFESSEDTYQCCWLHWSQVEAALRQEVADLLPDVRFRPFTLEEELPVALALTALPVRLEIDREQLRQRFRLAGDLPGEGSGTRLPLLVAWLGFSSAAIASVVLLRGLIKLSEQRASFVSAVTHELRTPLTTFRMYAEMLAEEMVPEEKKQQYANTLRVQAERLSHLVDNVLLFARLERSRDKVPGEVVRLNELIHRFEPRFRDRAGEDDLVFKVSGLDRVSGQVIETQPAVVEQLLFNLVDNACKYGTPSQTGEVELVISRQAETIRFEVRDGGPGIDADQRRTMFRPFHKSDQDAANSRPGVGLGLALCQRMARTLGGRLYYQPLQDGASFVLEIRNDSR